jgi:hypothetical protein
MILNDLRNLKDLMEIDGFVRIVSWRWKQFYEGKCFGLWLMIEDFRN